MGALREDRVARCLALLSDSRFIDEVCSRVVGGETLIEICRGMDIPYWRVMMWIIEQGHTERYREALFLQAQYEVDEAKAIADAVEDPSTVNVAKLRIETRFRRARAHAAKIYGGDVADGGRVMPVLNITVLTAPKEKEIEDAQGNESRTAVPAIEA